MSKVSANGIRSKHDGDWMWLNCELIRSHLDWLSRTELAVYIVLAMHSNNATQATFVHQQTIAKLCGCSLSQVRRALDRLERLGLIDSERKRHGNHYTLLKVPVRGHGYAVSPRMRARSDTAWVRGVKEPDSVNQTLKNQTLPDDPNAPARPGASPGLVPPSCSRKNDDLLKAVTDVIEREYSAANPDRPVVPWTSGGRDRRMLLQLFKGYPSWTLAEWTRSIVNRFASQNIIPGEPPEGFIRKLPGFIHGPHNRFGHTLPQPEEVERVRKDLENRFSTCGGYTASFIEDLRRQLVGNPKAAVLEEALLKIEAVYGPPHGQYVN